MLTRENIVDYWDKIEPYILSLKDKTGWDAQDVFNECINETAHLFLCEDGFLIIQEHYEQFSHKKILFIWIAHSFDSSKNLIEIYEEDIRNIAKIVMADKICFGSERLGFKRKLDDRWYIKSILYETEV